MDPLDGALGVLDAYRHKAIQAGPKVPQRNLGITCVFLTNTQSEALTWSDRHRGDEPGADQAGLVALRMVHPSDFLLRCAVCRPQHDP